MSTVALIVTIELANVAVVDRLQATLVAYRDLFLRNEPGTLQFDILRPEGTEGKVIIYEVFANEAALEAHHAGDSKKQGLAEIEDIQYEVVSTKCIRLD